jgi:hypothetical protein
VPTEEEEVPQANKRKLIFSAMIQIQAQLLYEGVNFFLNVRINKPHSLLLMKRNTLIPVCFKKR